VIISAADPLNLLGIITPGARVSPYSNQAIAYRGGLSAGVGLLGELVSRLQHSSLPQPV
jgi:ATP-dependent Lhr-like helicase